MLLLLGLLLLGAVAAVTIGVIDANRSDVDVSVFGQSDTLTVAGVYLAGAVSGLVLAIGLSLVVSGMSRRHRRRKERKLRDRERAAQQAELAERNDRLEQQLAQTRHAVDTQARREQARHEAYPDEPASRRPDDANEVDSLHGDSGRHRAH